MLTSIAKAYDAKEISCIIQLVLIKPIEMGYAKQTSNTKRNVQLSGKQMRLGIIMGSYDTLKAKHIENIAIK